MASEVQICNLALSHLGDSSTVASIDPPEGSAQAEHCAQFYPIARDSLLEMHPWGFATVRVALAELAQQWSEWDHCYQQPSDVLNVLALLPPGATDDYSEGTGVPTSAGGRYVPQPFSCETLSNGTQVIFSDQADAVLRYTRTVSDPTLFSPLFTTTLSWHLASFLAGPVIKGEEGSAAAKRCAAMMASYMSKAIESDAGQRRVEVTHNVPWIVGR